MSRIEYDNMMMLYDMDNNKLHYGNKYKKYFDDLTPLINDLESYLISCKEIDFDKSYGKLKFNDTHAKNINIIFDNYKKLLDANHNNLMFYLLYYGYWLSNIVFKYYEQYFKGRYVKNSILKDNMFIYKKCTLCNEIIYKNIDNRSRYEGHIKDKYFYGWYNDNENPFICRDCKDKIQDDKNKKEQDEKNKYINNLKYMPYKDYLETDHWKQLRKRKLRLSGYKCQICASKENLNVHHNTYDNRGNEKDEDLVVLCSECHKKHHNINDISDINNIKSYVNINNEKTYTTKLFISDINKYDNNTINEFISNNVKELKDIKTNLSNNTYTTLLIYN